MPPSTAGRMPAATWWWCPDTGRFFVVAPASAACHKSGMGTPQNDSGSRTGKLPQWVLPVAALVAITVILTVALYTFQQSFVQEYTGFPAPAFPLLLFFVEFLWVGCVVLTIAFAIYVFNWLRETRVLLREIAANTRVSKAFPKPAEHKSESAWPPAPKPLIPPEEAKYMPKV